MSKLYKCVACGAEFQYPWQLRCVRCGHQLKEVFDE